MYGSRRCEGDVNGCVSRTTSITTAGGPSPFRINLALAQPLDMYLYMQSCAAGQKAFHMPDGVRASMHTVDGRAVYTECPLQQAHDSEQSFSIPYSLTTGDAPYIQV